MAKAKILIIRLREELDLDSHLKLTHTKNFMKGGLKISGYTISLKAKHVNLFVCQINYIIKSDKKNLPHIVHPINTSQSYLKRYFFLFNPISTISHTLLTNISTK